MRTADESTGEEGASLRRAFAAFPTGVVVAAGQGPDGPVGIAASTFTSVSLDPPLVSISLGRTSTPWPVLRRLPRIGLSVLSVHQAGLCRSLTNAGIAARLADAGVDTSPEGAVFIHESALWLDCEVHRELDAGDHGIVLLRICSMTSYSEFEPLVFHESRFRELVDDRAP